MTYKEKVKELFKNSEVKNYIVNNTYCGGMYACPIDYFDISEENELSYKYMSDCSDCYKCWDLQYQGENLNIDKISEIVSRKMRLRA